MSRPPPVPAFRRACAAVRPRAAFTLVEMLVSLAVLAVALTVIGVVFSVTTQVTRQAAAYSEAQNWVRQFTEQLEQDLRACEPSQAVLVLVGREQPAALTQADLDAGKHYRVLTGDPDAAKAYDKEYSTAPDPSGTYSDPRADLLMFTTNRPNASLAPPDAAAVGSFGEACRQGVKFSPTAVVYGHAALGRARQVDATTFEYPPDSELRHIEQLVGDGTQRSRIPADQWHLSRKAIILASWPLGASPGYPARVQFPAADAARLARCEPDHDLELPGDGGYFDVPLLLEMLSAQPPAYTGIYPLQPLAYPYQVAGSYQWDKTVVNSLASLMYATGSSGDTTNHHVATVLENPPAALRSNLGLHLLPGCAWFQVEFLMPEDPRNGQDYAPDPAALLPPLSKRQDMPRWTEVTSGQTYIFVPDTAENRALISADINPATGLPGARLEDFKRLDQKPGLDPKEVLLQRRVRTWPYAIRVTVRVFDPQGRLPEPIVRTVVHRFD